MATATSACAKSGASLVPSPVIATNRPSDWYWRINASFASGVASARKSSTPDSAAIAAAVRWLSPVIMTVFIPIWRSWAKRSLIPPFTISLSSTTPKIFWFSTTTSGVPPDLATCSTIAVTSSGKWPWLTSIWRRIASTEPLRIKRSPKLTPLILVIAEKGIKEAPIDAKSRSRKLKRCLARITILLPSGVSSASELNCAASASCFSLIPERGIKRDAWRLPSVIVPVLSRSKTSTSPAASTARPLVAITLASNIRLIPATPIDESKPPIVVGIRHTNKAIKVTTEITSPWPWNSTANTLNG